MSAKNTFITAVIILSLIAAKAQANEEYPVSYEVSGNIQGGKLVVSSFDGAIRSYLIKPRWNEESEVLYSWKGIERKDARGISMGASHLLSVFPVKENLLMIRRDGSKLFAILADSNAVMISAGELFGNFNEVEQYNATLVGTFSDSVFILRINNFLYSVAVDTAHSLANKLISTSALCAVVRADGTIAWLEANEGIGTVYVSLSGNEKKAVARMALSERHYFYDLGNFIGIVSSSANYKNSLVNIIDPDKGIIQSIWLETNGQTLRIAGNQDLFRIYYIIHSGSSYYLVIDKYKGKVKNGSLQSELSRELVEPLLVEIIDGKVYAVFRNNLSIFDQEGEIVAMDFLPVGEYIKSDPSIIALDNHIIIFTESASLVLSEKNNDFWWFFRFMKESGKVVIPLIFFVGLVIVLQFYRGQKRLLRAVLNLPSAGAVVVLDKNGRLERANASGKNLIGISGNLPMGKHMQYYFTKEHIKPMKELLEKAMEMKNSVSQKLNIVTGGDLREWYCMIVPLRTVTGFFTGLLFTGIDITEELERKRLSNWAQLAHDMQTNLSTIKLNAEQWGVGSAEDDNDRKKRILHQVNILMHRVRDVVTVGRSDGVDRQLVNGAEICQEVRSEFDDTMFPNVEIIANPQNAMVSCDRAKLTRALRNAVENAVRSLEGNPGQVTISNWTDPRFAYFSIRDTGAGMDEQTAKKMLKPYFTTSKKYGGMGMGTMIMQHVAELHGGKIDVLSEKGKGTEIVFSFPNYLNKRK